MVQLAIGKQYVAGVWGWGVGAGFRVPNLTLSCILTAQLVNKVRPGKPLETDGTERGAKRERGS